MSGTSIIVASTERQNSQIAASSMSPGRRPRWRRWNWPALVILTTLGALAVYPLLWVLFTSLKTEADYVADPVGLATNPTTESLRRVLVEGHALDYSMNSLLVVVPAVAIAAVVSICAGYALTWVRFRLRSLVLIGVIAMMAVPSSVVMIPTFRTIQELGLLDERPGLILVYAALYAPLSIYLAATGFRSLPREIFEAALVDGAGTLRTFVSVAIPLSLPTLRTIVVLNFLWLWNELLFGLLILQSTGKRTLMAGIAALQGEHSTPVPLLAAGLLVSLVPVLLVFFAAQRSLERGLTAGAVK